MKKRCMGCMKLYSDEFEVCPHCGYTDEETAEEAIHIEPNTILHDRYIIGKVLGYGGFGVTYISWDGKLEQKVAIKEYFPSEFSSRMPGQSVVTVFNGEKREQFYDGLEKFVDEAKRLAQFQNEEGIVKIFDSFVENKTAYIIMEYLDGETLKDKLERERVIPEDEAVNMLMPVLHSLKNVHEKGMIHRDIAPDNIFITKNGDVKLIDFGASRYATTSYSRSLTVVVKQGYSPEEQYRSRGDQGAYTDVYALAATLYRMITGTTPPDAMERRSQKEGFNKEILVEPHLVGKTNISVIRENAILNAMNVRIQDRTPDIDTFIAELNSEQPVKRRVGKIKKIDLYHWPLWLKIVLPSLMVVALVFGGLLATGVIRFDSLFSEKAVVPDGYVVVPDVENLDKDEAIALIKKNNLTPNIVDNVESEYINAGKIILQTPVGKSYLEINATVNLTLSAGVTAVGTVPFLEGDTEESAVNKLIEAGITERDISVEYKSNDNTISGNVISQSVPYGTEITERLKITLCVSTGPAAFEIPDVRGMSQTDATKLLQSKGLVVTVGYKEQSGKKKGEVLSQTPDSGSRIKCGAEVKLTVCSSENVVIVPDVLGKVSSDAEKIIEKVGLKVSVNEVYTDSPKGSVISQLPDANTGVKKGDTVVINVSKGKYIVTTQKPVETVATRKPVTTTNKSENITTVATTKAPTTIVTDIIKPSSVSLVEYKTSMLAGDGMWFWATVYPTNAVDQTITWSSSNSSVVSVSDGWVEAKKPGVATITVKTVNGKSDSCTVTVTDVWREVSVLPSYVNSSEYYIEYKHTYEKKVSSSPGSGWIQGSKVRDQKTGESMWKMYDNLGDSTWKYNGTWEYFHWCVADSRTAVLDVNWYWSNYYVHEDTISSVETVYVASQGKDTDGYPFYSLKWKSNNADAYCNRSVTCNNGTHGKVSYHWYKHYQYDKYVPVYKYTKQSGWTSSKDTSAKSITYRYKLK